LNAEILKSVFEDDCWNIQVEKCLLDIEFYATCGWGNPVAVQKTTQLQNAKASTTHGKEKILCYFAVLYM
jgi:hypothetical protein